MQKISWLQSKPFNLTKKNYCFQEYKGVLCQIWRTTKNHPLEAAKKCVKTYSSSNAAAPNPEERVQLNKLEHFTIDYIQKLFIKQLITGKRKASEDKDW